MFIEFLWEILLRKQSNEKARRRRKEPIKADLIK
jgi:hypothetical protein